MDYEKKTRPECDFIWVLCVSVGVIQYKLIVNGNLGAHGVRTVHSHWGDVAGRSNVDHGWLRGHASHGHVTCSLSLLVFTGMSWVSKGCVYSPAQRVPLCASSWQCGRWRDWQHCHGLHGFCKGQVCAGIVPLLPPPSASAGAGEGGAAADGRCRRWNVRGRSPEPLRHYCASPCSCRCYSPRHAAATICPNTRGQRVSAEPGSATSASSSSSAGQ